MIKELEGNPLDIATYIVHDIYVQKFKNPEPKKENNIDLTKEEPKKVENKKDYKYPSSKYSIHMDKMTQEQVDHILDECKRIMLTDTGTIIISLSRMIDFIDKIPDFEYDMFKELICEAFNTEVKCSFILDILSKFRFIIQDYCYDIPNTDNAKEILNEEYSSLAMMIPMDGKMYLQTISNNPESSCTSEIHLEETFMRTTFTLLKEIRLWLQYHDQFNGYIKGMGLDMYDTLYTLDPERGREYCIPSHQGIILASMIMMILIMMVVMKGTAVRQKEGVSVNVRDFFKILMKFGVDFRVNETDAGALLASTMALVSYSDAFTDKSAQVILEALENA